MGRPKGSKNKLNSISNPVGNATPARGEGSATKIDDLQYEVTILKAALKQLIRESRDWRIKSEKVLDVLTDRCQRHLLTGYDNGGKLVRDRNLDEKRGAEPGIRAGTL